MESRDGGAAATLDLIIGRPRGILYSAARVVFGWEGFKE